MNIETKYGLEDVVWVVVDSEIRQCQIVEIIISSERGIQYKILTGLVSGDIRDEGELFASREDLGWAILNDEL